jgi:hypothetical protein
MQVMTWVTLSKYIYIYLLFRMNFGQFPQKIYIFADFWLQENGKEKSFNAQIMNMFRGKIIYK